MWCPTCQQKVAKPPLTDGEQAACAVCQTELLESAPAKPSAAQDKSNEALKLLERWSDQRMLSPTGEVPEKIETSPLPEPELPVEQVSQQRRPARQKSGSRPKRKPFQKASSEPSTQTPQPKIFKHTGKRDESPALSSKATPATSASHTKNKAEAPSANQQEPTFRTVASKTSEKRTPKFRIDSAPHSSTAAPHFDVQAAIREQLMKQERSWISAIGYIFSYGGIALLTAGAGLTLWSFYEGTLESIPSEWLVTTVGQVFLFAGMVMLVALVMERIGNKILYRVSQVDDRIARLERVVATIAENRHESRSSNSKETTGVKKVA